MHLRYLHTARIVGRVVGRPRVKLWASSGKRNVSITVQPITINGRGEAVEPPEIDQKGVYAKTIDPTIGNAMAGLHNGDIVTMHGEYRPAIVLGLRQFVMHVVDVQRIEMQQVLGIASTPWAARQHIQQPGGGDRPIGGEDG